MTERDLSVTCGMYASLTRNLETSIAAGRDLLDSYWHLRGRPYDPDKLRDRIYNKHDLSFNCLSGAEVVISGRLFDGKDYSEGAIFSYVPDKKIDKKMLTRIAEQNGYDYNPSSNSPTNPIFAFFKRRNGSFDPKEIRMFAAAVAFLEDESARIWNIIWELVVEPAG